MTKIPDVAWSRVAGFVRKHTHEFRNDLNGLDLEAALLADLITEGEASECVARMRRELRKVAERLRTLSSKFADVRPNRVLLPARELFLIWRETLTELPGLEVEWIDRLGTQQVNVDPGSVALALRELLVNAHAFRAEGTATAIASGIGTVQFELREPKTETIDPSRWGQTPLDSTRRGSLGLGLCTVLRTIEANEGAVSWRFDPERKILVTNITFPAMAAH